MERLRAEPEAVKPPRPPHTLFIPHDPHTFPTAGEGPQPAIGPFRYADELTAHAATDPALKRHRLAKDILSLLATASARTGSCYRSIRRMADQLGTVPHCVRRALKTLKALGYIRPERPPGRVLYTFHLPIIPTLRVVRAAAQSAPPEAQATPRHFGALEMASDFGALEGPNHFGALERGGHFGAPGRPSASGHLEVPPLTCNEPRVKPVNGEQPVPHPVMTVDASIAEAPAPTPAVEKAANLAEADEAREEQIRARWDALAEARREEIAEKNRAENPGLRKFPGLLQVSNLAALEAELVAAGEIPAATAREEARPIVPMRPRAPKAPMPRAQAPESIPGGPSVLGGSITAAMARVATAVAPAAPAPALAPNEARAVEALSKALAGPRSDAVSLAANLAAQVLDGNDQYVGCYRKRLWDGSKLRPADQAEFLKRFMAVLSNPHNRGRRFLKAIKPMVPPKGQWAPASPPPVPVIPIPRSLAPEAEGLAIADQIWGPPVSFAQA